MLFTKLELDEKIQSAINDIGYERCTPVQEQAFPESLAGKDMVVQSQTGTGKTAVFAVTILQRLLINPPSNSAIKALVLVPTRELAVQVETQAKELAKNLPFNTLSVFGGVGYDEQEKQLKKGADIIVATPGRLIDFVKSKKVDLSGLSFFVVDEADRMFDMGFMPDVRFILQKSPSKDKRQTMIFSATLDSRVRRISEQFMRDSVEVEIEPNQITVDRVEQKLYHVSKEEKLPLLLTLMKIEEMPKVIIFTNMKRTAERLVFKLEGNGFSASVLTGDVDQKKRLRIIENFKNDKINILVATDVAARGIHVDGITHVINYDVPNAAANYVHRIGRTARAGADGKAYTLACEDSVEYLPEVEEYIEQKIKVSHITFDLEKDNAGYYKNKSSREPSRGSRHSEVRRPFKQGTRPDRKPQGTSHVRPSKQRMPRNKNREETKSHSGAISKTMSKKERLAYYEKKYGGSFS